MVRWRTDHISDSSGEWSIRCSAQLEMVVTWPVLLSPGHVSRDTGPQHCVTGATDTGHCDTQVDPAPGQRSLVTVAIHCQLQ